MSTRFAQAIAARRIIEFSYKGRARSVEPHALGYDVSGALVLHGWELSGGGRPALRGFDMRTIRALVVTGREFGGARPDYAPESLPLRTVVSTL